MACHTESTTNGKLAEVMTEIRTLIEWAEADAQHARENGAADTATDDDRRAKNLQRALAYLTHCIR